MGKDRKDRDILQFFGDQMTGDTRRFDYRMAQPPLDNAFQVNRMFVNNPALREWLIDNDGMVSEDGIKRGLNFVKQTFFGRTQDIDLEAFEIDETQSNGNFLVCIRLTYTSLAKDLDLHRGRALKRIIEQSYPAILDILMDDEDLREPLMSRSDLTTEDLETILVASTVVLMAERLQEKDVPCEDRELKERILRN